MAWAVVLKSSGAIKVWPSSGLDDGGPGPEQFEIYKTKAGAFRAMKVWNINDGRPHQVVVVGIKIGATIEGMKGVIS